MDVNDTTFDEVDVYLNEIEELVYLPTCASDSTCTDTCTDTFLAIKRD